MAAMVRAATVYSGDYIGAQIRFKDGSHGICHTVSSRRMHFTDATGAQRSLLFDQIDDVGPAHLIEV